MPIMEQTDGRLDILGLTRKAFETEAGLGAGRSRALGVLYKATLASGRFETGEIGIAASAAASLSGHFRVGLLKPLITTEESGPFGVTAKALLRLDDGETIECVKIPTPGERSPATLCVSTQVGCRMGCAFCETGRRGLVRNLGAAEIVSELVTARVSLGWNIGNIVFMGMGEPLDNFEALSGALAVFLDSSGTSFSQERLTICTVGLPAGIAKLRALGLKRLNLSISLNAPDDETRSRLMPANRGIGLELLAAALASYPQRNNFTLGVNYCLIPGLNDGPGAAEGIAAFIARAAKPGRAFVNLIPYNPGTAPIGRAPDDAEVEAFESRLTAKGLIVKLRRPRGRGLMAACGQLGGPLPINGRNGH